MHSKKQRQTDHRKKIWKNTERYRKDKYLTACLPAGRDNKRNMINPVI
jgi:hypothetical protein